jgi:hypothetical protein
MVSPSFSTDPIYPRGPQDILLHANSDKERSELRWMHLSDEQKWREKSGALFKHIWIGISRPFLNKCRFTSPRRSGNEHEEVIVQKNRATAIYPQAHQGTLYTHTHTHDISPLSFALRIDEDCWAAIASLGFILLDDHVLLVLWLSG